jgi:hypothetical protein
MVTYSHDSNDYYPFISNSTTVTSNPGNVSTGMGGGIMQDVFYLVGKGDVGAKQFLCKSDPASVSQSNSPVANTAYPYYSPNYFTNSSAGASADFCYSYSFATPFFSGGGSTVIGAWWKNSMDSSCPVAGDLNPGSVWSANAAVVRKGNSVNHQGDGQNLGYGDGHAEFSRTPIVGEANDHVYSSGSAGTGSINNPGVISSSAVVSTATGNTQGTFDTWLVPGANNATYQRQ